MPDQHDEVIRMRSDIDHLKEWEMESRTDIKKIRDDIGVINVTTAEIKAMLNGKKPNGDNGKWMLPMGKLPLFIILALIIIIAALIGVDLPIH